MATIYELTENFKELLELLESEEIDDETFKDTVESLNAELEDKAENYAKIINMLNGNIDTIDTEMDRLKGRKEALKNNVTRMKQDLEQTMRVTGKTKFKTALFSFGIQKNPASVVMEVQDLDKIPQEYLVKQDPKIDKAKIKEDLKAGKNLKGLAHLEQGESLRIR